jgi:nucleoside 2-deoxyribosyltransferase
MHKVYVASSLNNIERAKEVIDNLLSTNKISVTYDWTKHGRVHSVAEMQEISLLETEGVKNCDTILVVLPGGVGTHFEFGYAYALGKNVVLLEEVDVRRSSFYHLPGIHSVKTFGEALAIIERLSLEHMPPSI